MSESHGGICGVHGLAARTGGAIDVHAQVIFIDVDVVSGLHHGKHLNLSKGGLPPALVIKWTDTHQAVGSLLHGQRSVHVLTVDHQRGGFDSGLFRIGDVIEIHLVAGLFRPPGVHAQQHLGEVRGIHTTGSGADIHHGLALVVFAGKHGGYFQRLDFLTQFHALVIGQSCGFLGFLWGIPGFFLGHFVHHGDVFQALTQATHALELRLDSREFAGDGLRVIRVIPQGWICGLFLQLAHAGG